MIAGFLWELTWKSGVISLMALSVIRMLRRSAPADRVAIGRATILFLLVLPLACAAGPKLPLPNPIPDVRPPATLPLQAAAPEARAFANGLSFGLVLSLAYLAGFTAFSLRLLFGIWLLRAWTKAAEPVVTSEWACAFERARAIAGPKAERARLFASASVSSPISWGWRRPVILVDRASLPRVQDADAILGHELAHVARRDWLFLLAAHAATILFWFNPLVRLLQRELIEAAEEAADGLAILAVEPTSYAQSLLSCACRRAVRAPGVAIAGESGLSRRISLILSETRSTRGLGPIASILALCICLGAYAPVAAMTWRRAPAIAMRAAKPATRSRLNVEPRRIGTDDGKLAAKIAPKPIHGGRTPASLQARAERPRGRAQSTELDVQVRHVLVMDVRNDIHIVQQLDVHN